MSTKRTIDQDDQLQYYTASKDPHTAIPDWIPFCLAIGAEARNLITATLVLQKRGEAPTRRDLARALAVDERTVYRWSRELASAGAMTVRRSGRRMIAVFHRPKPDQAITDRPITDRPITDRPIRFQDSSESNHARPTSHETAIPDQAISDPLVVGVGESISLKKDSPTATQRRPLKTPLARWLKQYGMNAAREFDDPKLDYATYKAWVEHKRNMGWEWRQIVSTLRESPLDQVQLDQAAPLDQLDQVQLDQAAPLDQLDQLDSTSIALARRFEKDRAEAQERAIGLVDARGKRT